MFADAFWASGFSGMQCFLFDRRGEGMGRSPRSWACLAWGFPQLSSCMQWNLHLNKRSLPLGCFGFVMAWVCKRLPKVLRLDRNLCRADGFGVPATGMPPRHCWSSVPCSFLLERAGGAQLAAASLPSARCECVRQCHDDLPEQHRLSRRRLLC